MIEWRRLVLLTLGVLSLVGGLAILTRACGLPDPIEPWWHKRVHQLERSRHEHGPER